MFSTTWVMDVASKGSNFVLVEWITIFLRGWEKQFNWGLLFFLLNGKGNI